MKGTLDERQVTGEQPHRRPRPKWVIRVTSHGQDMWLRHGFVPGRGRIVTFNSKADAELNAEAMIAPGLDEGDIVSVVRYSEREHGR
jgi:hypothetical protein